MTTKTTFTPKFFGMKKEDIFKIEYFENYIEGYNEQGLRVYGEDSNGYLWKMKYNGQDSISYYKYSNNCWCEIRYNKRDL